MHTLDPSTSNVTGFLVKLWKLVEDHDCDDFISWSEKGTSFVIRDQARFSRELLPKYFKHNNMASFIRQLNMYGFRKWMNYEKGMTDSDEMEFYHEYFQKDSEELLKFIKRKLPSTRGPEFNANPKDILTDLATIREKQENMNNILTGVKRENDLLWRELSSLRQKHKTQEQIIQKVIHFLVTIVQSSNQNIGVKRKIAHMLKDSTGTSNKRSRRLVDMVRGKNPDFFISVPDDKATSPEGPVIHEVTELDHEYSLDFKKSLPSSSRSNSRQSETFVQVDSPLSTSVNVPSPAECIDLLEPLSNKSDLSYTPSAVVEEILGMPMEFSSRNTVSLPSDTINIASVSDDIEHDSDSSEIFNLISIPETNVISIPEEVSNVISIPETNVISIPETNVISIPEEVSNVISIPESSNMASLSGITRTKDGRFILSPDVVPFSPSAVTVLSEDNPSTPMEFTNSAAMDTSNMAFLDEESATKQISDLCKTLLSPVMKQEKKQTSCRKLHSGWNTPKKEIFNNSFENHENATLNNLQLAISDTNPSAENMLTKNAFSNHVSDVDANLEYLQNHLEAELFDSAVLFELFNLDDAANNAAQVSQLNMDNTEAMKDPDSNIIGNELVQFNPSMFDLDDLGNTRLFDSLCENVDFPAEDEKLQNSQSASPAPVIIKQEKEPNNSSCLFGNNSITNSQSECGKKTKGRGKRKMK